ncbi:5 -methylthioadenosine s-adenosylhomocysteine [Stemphylium lycopersici]|nr:5 -methylthioadenosine s-adenosylhomocysteine [Stemphylium lycopersici]
MASTPPPSQSAPMRSPDKPNVDLRHPVPDLQSLQGAYVGNINRLEEHAERMSESGSDLQEEIRKTYSELKLTESRRSSLRDWQTGEEPTRQFSTRSRGVSMSSHANSIVDLNGNARWGGYSPGGYITSPAGSLHSGGWSKPSTSIQRQRSESKASRLGQIVHPEEVEEDGKHYEAHPTSPTSPRSAPLAEERDSSPPPQRKVSSFTRLFDDVANALPEELRNSIITGTPPRPTEERHAQNAHYQYQDQRDFPDRPPTAASTDTTHQARTLWQDFDGVHCPNTVEEEPEPSHHSHHGHSRQSSHNHSFMDHNPGRHSMGAPPPEDGMVFYPAPVPRMLNLPKRLSQLPPSDVRTRRQTQLLESMQTENRKSMALLGDTGDEHFKANKRKSRQSLMALPPQLRASAYFDNLTTPTQEFAVKGDSAENTLESILDASAHAPVSAFTDHPFAGNVSREVYGTEHKRRSSKMPEVPPPLQETRRRSSFNILDTNHNTDGKRLKKLKKRNSSADMNLLLVKASESRMSLGDQLEERDEDARGPSAEHDTNPRRSRYYETLNQAQHEEEEAERRQEASDGEEKSEDEDEESEAEGEEEEEEEEPQWGAPTTLLAELQLRQAKQKTRKMNYVTLMEQGLIDGRQTLLQMNDVAEAEKQRRIRKKVNLAWEAPEDDSDDDVPLGVLYKQPVQQMPRRIMGLIEQREMEDHEPLSRRRNRLRGIDPNQRQTQHQGASTSQLNLAVPEVTTDPISDEEEGETLADRMRRLKEKQQRESALGGDVRKSTVSGDFAAEMMSRFGGAEGQDETKDSPKAAAPPQAEEEEEEETLGQRRARLQAEAAARGEQPSSHRPGLRSTNSLADILSANPLDPHNQSRKVSNEVLLSHLPQGSLLHQNVVDTERKKQQRLSATRRASSYGSFDPLVKGIGSKEKEDDDDNIPLGQKIQAYKNAQNPMMMMRNPQQQQQQQQGMMGMNGMGMMSQPNLNMQQQQQPAMGMGINMGMQPPPPQQQQQQYPGMMRQNSMMPGMQMPMQMPGMQMSPMQINGMQMQMPMQMGMQMPMGMGMQMPMGMMQGQMMGPPMDPRQRDQIDRWMSGIRH